MSLRFKNTLRFRCALRALRALRALGHSLRDLRGFGDFSGLTWKNHQIPQNSLALEDSKAFRSLEKTNCIPIDSEKPWNLRLLRDFHGFGDVSRLSERVESQYETKNLRMPRLWSYATPGGAGESGS